VRLPHGAEDAFLTLALLATMILPLAEIFLRTLFKVGISGATSIVQQLTLVVGMAGGAIAAREGRLLALAGDALFPAGRIRSALRILSFAVGAAVTSVLFWASGQFVRSEVGSGKILVYGIPLWVVQLALPLGFGLIAARLLWGSGESWKGRLAAAALCACLIAACLWLPVNPASLRWPALVVLLVSAAVGAPVFTLLGGAALILFWGADVPVAAVAVEHYRLVTNPSLPAIPLFTLAGYYLAEGGASARLIRVFKALFGSVRGGPAIVTVLVCAFFTTFTGASGVTVLALGGLLMPVLLAAEYSERDALGLLTGAGSLGLLFPPCLPLILYAIVAKVPVESVFLGGVVPGVLMVVLAAGWGVLRMPKGAASGHRFDAREAWGACWVAKWELLLPLVALGSLLSGYATPVEASALTALYALAVEVWAYGDLRLGRDLVRVTAECGLVVGGVLLILGVALGFTNYLVDAEIPARAVAAVTASVHSPLLFLLLLNLFLLVVGCLLDIYSAIVVVVPLIVPLGLAFGIDPVHLGIIFLANLQLGYLTPPVGMNLFLASYRFKKPLLEVTRATLPMLLILLVGVLAITYAPFLTTLLPSWLAR
jgi:C4-dicarboxylate transporter, DctM subunit